MVWWQIVLIILTSIIVGLLVGGLLSYLIARMQNRPFWAKHKPMAMLKEKLVAVVEERPTPVIEEQKAEVAKKETFSAVAEQESSAVEERLETTLLNIAAEVENNRKIAIKPRTDELLTFQTHIWDTNQDEIRGLNANLREKLTQAYLDLRQANDIVWLSKGVHYRSQYLDKHYEKLCTRIAERLDEIEPLLKGLGN